MLALTGSWLWGEWSHFLALPRQARYLLGASTLAAFAMPAMGVFAFAFVMRDTQDVNRVMAYQFALYTGIPVAFVLNRYLVALFSYARLYAFGIVLSALVLGGMTCLGELTVGRIVGVGLAMGLAVGFHWANRNYLSLVCTVDDNRNYFYGIESFFACVSAVVVPLLIGFFIDARAGAGAPPAEIRAAYRWVSAVALALVAGGGAFLLRPGFPCEPPELVAPGRRAPVWRLLLALAALRGTVQIFLTTAPAVLVMRVLGGRESALGQVQACGALLAAVIVYLVGRRSRPEHRVAVVGGALLLYAAGAAANGLLFTAETALVFIACQLVAQPTMELAFGAIMLRVMDAVADGHGGGRYAYVVSHELGIFAGRCVGAAAFIALSCQSTGETAFRYILALLALLHLLCWPVAARIDRLLARPGAAGG